MIVLPRLSVFSIPSQHDHLGYKKEEHRKQKSPNTPKRTVVVNTFSSHRTKISPSTRRKGWKNISRHKLLTTPPTHHLFQKILSLRCRQPQRYRKIHPTRQFVQLALLQVRDVHPFYARVGSFRRRRRGHGEFPAGAFPGCGGDFKPGVDVTGDEPGVVLGVFVRWAIGVR